MPLKGAIQRGKRVIETDVSRTVLIRIRNSQLKLKFIWEHQQKSATIWKCGRFKWVLKLQKYSCQGSRMMPLASAFRHLYHSLLAEHSGTWLGPLITLPDWFRHRHFCSFRSDWLDAGKFDILAFKKVPCTSTLLVSCERDTKCTSKLQVVESDTPCTSRQLLMVFSCYLKLKNHM
jgi:hypothetical protein